MERTYPETMFAERLEWVRRRGGIHTERKLPSADRHDEAVERCPRGSRHSGNDRWRPRDLGAGGHQPTTMWTSTSERRMRRALEALEATGMTTSMPPEGWLVKAHDGRVLVDLIYRPAGGPIGDEHFDAGELDGAHGAAGARRVDRRRAVTKLMALSEQEPDFGAVIELPAHCASRSTGGSCGGEPRARRSQRRSSRSSRALESQQFRPGT